ncbi:Putative DNA mismatch repair protein, S5 domain 2 [Colletotrichum destructivum]|uniref:DNA mismatch repair protein, S5 domain 2 n=1 Tax=Colletotrichum destructivum TaxID=34406 RepID=A0AAX4INI8_9PEZI|nr:Putative DNA mismatch repair protein, S5 domain 2 [Colletotrichum destructivum]
MADADASKISGQGYFISVDSRPMSTDRGTMKKLVDIYKTYIRGSLKVNASSKPLLKPFIRLNIQCLIGSYDPNVTAAKDEVLFDNESRVLSFFEEMCKEMYSSPKPMARAEVVEDHAQVDNSRPRKSNPSFLLDNDEERLNGLPHERLAPDDMMSVEDGLAGLPSPSSGQHHPGPAKKGVRGGSVHDDVGTPEQGQVVLIDSSSEVPSHRHEPDMFVPKQGAILHIGGEVFGASQLATQDQSLMVIAGSQCSTEPTQSLLRAAWEVDMARDVTASPDGNTRPILLDPPRTDLTKYLQSQRLGQTQREEPNPWSIAKKAAEKRGDYENNTPNSLAEAEFEVQGDSFVGTSSRHQLLFSETENFMRRDSDIVHPSIEDHANIRRQHPRRHRNPAVRREEAYQADYSEPPILEHPAAQQGGIHGLRYQDRRRITRDEEPFQSTGVEHNSDDLNVEPSRGHSVCQRAYAKTPHPFGHFDQESAFGTPPPSSSPSHKPFRVPARIRPGKQRREMQGFPGVLPKVARAVSPKADRMRQGKIVFNTGKDQKPLEPEYTLDNGHSIGLGYKGSRDDVIVSETTRRPPRHVSDDGPSQKEMKNALERLHALRSNTDDTDCIENLGQDEKRGRSKTRRPNTIAPGTFPRSYLRRSLASRSPSRNKTLLAFERLSAETYTYSQLLTLDLRKIRKQVIKASCYDVYVSRGEQEAAFSTGLAEMEDISNRLQEVVGAWAYVEHGEDLEIEIDVVAMLERNGVEGMIE